MPIQWKKDDLVMRLRVRELVTERGIGKDRGITVTHRSEACGPPMRITSEGVYRPEGLCARVDLSDGGWAQPHRIVAVQSITIDTSQQWGEGEPPKVVDLPSQDTDADDPEPL